VTAFQLLVVVIGLTLGSNFPTAGMTPRTPSPPSFPLAFSRLSAPSPGAFWNFIAAFFFGTAVASTIGKGMIHIEMISQQVLLAAFSAPSRGTSSPSFSACRRVPLTP